MYWRGKHEGAHRIAYMVFKGPIPGGMVVCHRCDTPKCVRPGHLFLGTKADNTRDMFKKGRQGRRFFKPGEAHPYAKLDLESVNMIRFLLALGNTQEYVAGLFHVSRTEVNAIHHRRRWAV